MGAAGSFFSFLLSHIFTEKCLICGAAIPQSIDLGGRFDRAFYGFFCARHTFSPVTGIELPARALCRSCWLKLSPALGQEPPLLGGVSVIAPFRTCSILLALVKYLKYSDGRSAASPLSWWMAEALIRYAEKPGAPDLSEIVLVPVPLHRSRERRRRYNQAELLARGIAARSACGVRTDIVFRKKRTRSQAKLAPEKRKSNVAGAFRAAGGSASGGIVLVDDLVTTGETAGECLRVLASAGHSVIAVLAAGTSL
ncbi:MAG: hypothetical protein R6U43_07540 [Candidatus Krumholzibacteriales bacterium]